jgi:GT2 family glycosyltransferase
VIPTLIGGRTLLDCLQSLVNQSRRDFEVIVVDNSGRGVARENGAEHYGAVILENKKNAGFGAAINAAFRQSRAPFLAILNDDAVACPDWICALLSEMEARPEAGMCASQVRLEGGEFLDSAGMLISGDGTTKQRGHLESPDRHSRPEDVLFPSGSAAMYRREMLEDIGLFDEDFFLYCEDSDLGLRGRWAGWKCCYAPGAVVEHRYSRTAGRASALKAYYVERNRLFLILKNFPAGLLVRSPWYAVQRYFWHAVSLFQGRGSAARFHEDNSGFVQLGFILLRAHFALLFRARRLWRNRRQIRARARIGPDEFRRLIEAHFITPRQVAAQ